MVGLAQARGARSSLARRAPALLILTLLGASPVLARAPSPSRAIPASLYSGRWYEAARTPNFRENGCARVYNDFSGMTGSSVLLTQTCVRRSGRLWVNRARAQVVPGTGNTKFKLGFLGGLIHQEYWILDVSPAADWAILATPGGHYVWLLARRPEMAAPTQAAALARIAALCYQTDKLRVG